MEYHEFNEDNVSPSLLQTNTIDVPLYTEIHKHTVIVCHDILLRCKHGGKKGILLVERLNEPAKNIFWPIGGRLLRGFGMEESIRNKVKKESGLDAKNITYLSTERTIFKGDPFGHGVGTDTLNLVFIADSKGIITLDKFHTKPLIITRESYKTLRPTLANYVQTVMDIVEKRNLW